jgi:S1-C subfamily serine protease
MQEKKSRTPWIVCGVIALVVVCGGGFLLLGGVGLLAYINGKASPTPAVALLATPTPPLASTQAAIPLNTPNPTRPAVADQTAVAEQTAVTEPPSIAGVPYRSVVQILAMVNLDGSEEVGWTGSGSIISPDGLVLTNAHVVLSDRYYQVDHLVVALTVGADQPPEPKYIAKVYQVDQALDIAVIRVETDLDGNPVDPAALNLPAVEMGSADQLTLGDPLTIIGYPGIGGSTITLTRGEVAGFTAEEGYGNRAFIKTSATISGGNSGGLAADQNGKLIGIPTQLGYGGDDQYVDCRVLVDTNRDGVVDDNDSCVPTGGFINALRPITLAVPYIEAAKRGEINIKEGVEGQQGEVPEDMPANVIYSDGFTDPGSGWDASTWDTGSTEYKDGEYQITVSAENWLAWSYHGGKEQDLGISVQTRVVNPTGVGDYGVMCRFLDEDDYYALEVSEDGYFSIWKMLNGEMSPIYDWTYSDAIPVDEPFRIDAACVGNRLLLGVNDTLLADVTDDALTESGQYGMIVGTLDQPGLTVGFDDFTVYQP